MADVKNGYRIMRFWPLLMGLIVLVGFLYNVDLKVKNLEAQNGKQDERIERGNEFTSNISADMRVLKSVVDDIKDDVSYLRQILTPAIE